MDVAMLMPNNGWKSLVIKLHVELEGDFTVRPITLHVY